ncbi:hypothetical protein DERF_000642 [Dermatophagoides farinae]|uniref:Uncharacterized protein n=1 Tax=Dermatophagoides farinae TaxID=6954 RepID=A0A922I6Z8_DERFA|nr:uncharacterized protein LOC124495769 [Dermatophagoides farinae]KAH7640936.1 hypothetical protein HUG17_8405 [Dermatophagoides farinae]KAH9526567.1 hypothetical protein DERF_000642 [Dermatophagoides farinae]
MPRITFPFKIHRSRSYTLNDDCQKNSCKHHQNVLRIGGEYVPVFEILNFGSVSDKELLYIRIAKQGLIISHKPSVNLSSLAGSLDRPKSEMRNYHVLPAASNHHHLYLQRYNTLRGPCHRTRSDRCRLIKWDQISGIQILKPKSLIFKLNRLEDNNIVDDCDTDVVDELRLYRFCSHRNENISLASLLHDYRSKINDNDDDELLRFEFLIKQDLEAMIAFGIHHQLLQPDDDGHCGVRTFDHIKNTNNTNNKNGKIFSRLFRWINRHMIVTFRSSTKQQ